MATRISKPQSVGRKPQASHERTDVHAGWIFGAVFFLAVTLALVHLLMREMFGRLERRPPTTDQWHNARPVSAAQAPGKFPRLQVSPPLDLEAFRAREETALNSFGWINQTDGLVSIPIQQAIDLLLKRGVPSRLGTNEVRTGPSTYELIQQRSAQGESDRP